MLASKSQMFELSDKLRTLARRTAVVSERVLGDATGVTGLRVIRAIVAGERNPHAPAWLRERRCKHTAADIAADIAKALRYTRVDPWTKKPVYVAGNMEDRKFRRALMQFFGPANSFGARGALAQAGRARPPHTVANPAGGGRPGECSTGPPVRPGYRPGRKSQRRQQGKRN